MIDILIPTFNRSESLAKNLTLLNDLLIKERLIDCFRILVSNNCSTDETDKMLEEFSLNLICKLVVYNQSTNIGLERNSIFLLQKSESKFVIYLGDDDYLPEGYLTELYFHVNTEPALGVVIPGFTSVDADGNKRVCRKILKGNLKLNAGFLSVLRLSSYGHQLSGLLLRRDGLLESYTSNELFRNIYPFIFFVARNNEKFVSIFASRFQVLVSISNSKDWRYDEIGLLGEIIKNYKILYPSSVLKQTLASFCLIARQRWRLRISVRPTLYLPALKAIKHFTINPVPPILLKILIVLFLPVLYLVELFSVFVRLLPNRQAK